MSVAADPTGFLEAICADPDDMISRLVYADWLEEQGTEWTDRRAEFIRVQMALAAEIWPCDCGSDNRRECQCAETRVLRHRERQLLQIVPPTTNIGQLDYGNGRIRWRRGFVERITCDTENWLTHGPAIVRAQPIRVVKLMDWSVSELPPNPSPIVRSYSRWTFYYPIGVDWRKVNDAFPQGINLDADTEAGVWQSISALFLRWARGPHEGLEALPLWEPKT